MNLLIGINQGQLQFSLKSMSSRYSVRYDAVLWYGFVLWFCVQWLQTSVWFDHSWSLMSLYDSHYFISSSFVFLFINVHSN